VLVPADDSAGRVLPIWAADDGAHRQATNRLGDIDLVSPDFLIERLAALAGYAARD